MNTSPPQSQAAPDSRLIFLHVPKSAGTTLWLILRRQYSPRAVLRVDDPALIAALTQEQWDEARVLLGHFPYGIPVRWPPPTATITVLRDPLERLLSHYGHAARTPDHLLVRKALAETGGGLTLEDYLDAGIPSLDNEQTRMLAGPEALALPFGACDREVFEAAKRHLTDDIAVTGLTERFDETLLLLQGMFGWNPPCYVAENVGTSRPAREAVPPKILPRLSKMTQWDRELYALAAARLDEQIAQAGPAFPVSLRRFRRANARYQWMKSLVASGPLRAMKSRLTLERQMGLEAAVRAVLGRARPR